MQIYLAKTAGFCMGVRRVIKLALSTAHQHNNPIYTYGPLIHNPQVIDLLAKNGIKTIKKVPLSSPVITNTVIIRAHGIPPEEKKYLKTSGVKLVVDGTCPRVIKVQTIIRRAANKGLNVIIIGDPNHPEVIGLLAYTRGNGYVINSTKEVKKIPEFHQIVVVAQTTQSKNIFTKICRTLKVRFSRIKIYDTICEATSRRQCEIIRLTYEAENIIVIGGCLSANTKRLAHIAAHSKRSIFLIETENDLKIENNSHFNSVGITAGASTPNWIIKKVIHKLNIINLTN